MSFVAVTVHLKISQTLCTDVNDNVCVFMIHRDKKNGKWKDPLNGLKLFVPHFELFFYSYMSILTHLQPHYCIHRLLMSYDSEPLTKFLFLFFIFIL